MRTNSSMSGRGLYRSRNGVILGVCKGVADYFDFSVFWIRAVAVVLLIFTGLWPVIGVYILAALLMKAAPAGYGGIRPQHRSKRGFACAKHDAADRLKRKWHHLEKRIQRMEDKVTSREFDWNNRFYG